MNESENRVPGTYFLNPKTAQRLVELKERNHGLSFGRVIDWAIEDLYGKQFGTENPEPITEREEIDRR